MGGGQHDGMRDADALPQVTSAFSAATRWPTAPGACRGGTTPGPHSTGFGRASAASTPACIRSPRPASRSCTAAQKATWSCGCRNCSRARSPRSGRPAHSPRRRSETFGGSRRATASHTTGETGPLTWRALLRLPVHRVRWAADARAARDLARRAPGRRSQRVCRRWLTRSTSQARPTATRRNPPDPDGEANPGIRPPPHSRRRGRQSARRARPPARSPG